MSSDQTTVDDLQKSTMDATAAKPPVAEKLPLAAQPLRALRLAVSGTAPSGTLLGPVVIAI